MIYCDERRIDTRRRQFLDIQLTNGPSLPALHVASVAATSAMTNWGACQGLRTRSSAEAVGFASDSLSSVMRLAPPACGRVFFDAKPLLRFTACLDMSNPHAINFQLQTG